MCCRIEMSYRSIYITSDCWLFCMITKSVILFIYFLFILVFCFFCCICLCIALKIEYKTTFKDCVALSQNHLFSTLNFSLVLLFKWFERIKSSSFHLNRDSWQYVSNVWNVLVLLCTGKDKINSVHSSWITITVSTFYLTGVDRDWLTYRLRWILIILKNSFQDKNKICIK